MPDIAKLGLEVGTGRSKQNVDSLDRSLERVGKRGTSVNRTFSSLGVTFAAGLALRTVIKNTSEAQQAMNQLEAVVASTGGAAGLTVRELDEMAQGLQQVTRFSDEAVKGGQAILLTFKEIGEETFERANAITLDLAQAMGTDLKSAAIQVGKALNDPTIGLTALSRSGITFTEAQSDLIKSLFEGGEKAEAQRLILAELESQFGGSARAARQDLGGALAFLKNQFDDFFEVTDEGSVVFVDGINAMGEAIPEVRRVILEFLGGIQILSIEAAVKIGELQLALSNLREFGDGKTGGVLDFLGLGEGAGVLDPFGLDLFSKALGVDLTKSADSAETELDQLRAAADELIAAMFDGLPVVADLTAAERALAEAAAASTEAADAAADAEKERARLRRVHAKFRQNQAREEEAEADRARARRIRLRNQVIAESERAEAAAADAAERAAIAAVEVHARAAEQIRNVMADALRDVFVDGLDGFADFADAIADIFTNLAAEIAASLAAEALGLDELIADLREGEKLSKAQGIGAGAALGFGIGSATNSAAGGALGGAASGFAVGGPLGAVAGGLTGFVTGLFGARKEAEALAEQMRKQNIAIAAARREATEAAKQGALGLVARGLSLTGQDDAAARASLDARQRSERQGLDARLLPLTEFVQELERIALEQSIALREQTEVINEALDAQLEAIDADLAISRDALAVAQEQLAAQEATVESLRGVLGSLTSFNDDLLLGPLSPLSPTAQLAESRAQFEAVLNAAREGDDLGAAGNLPGVARAFLEASREVNASSQGFVSDFDLVRTALADVIGDTQATLTVEEQILDQLENQTAYLEQQIQDLEDQRRQAEADAAEQIRILTEGYKAELAALAAQLDELRTQTDVLIEPGRDIDREIIEAFRKRADDDIEDNSEILFFVGEQIGAGLAAVTAEQRRTTAAIARRLGEDEVAT